MKVYSDADLVQVRDDALEDIERRNQRGRTPAQRAIDVMLTVRDRKIIDLSTALLLSRGVDA